MCFFLPSQTEVKLGYRIGHLKTRIHKAKDVIVIAWLQANNVFNYVVHLSKQLMQHSVENLLQKIIFGHKSLKKGHIMHNVVKTLGPLTCP